MVSLFKALSMTPRTEVNEESTKKRKWEEPFTEEFFIDKKSSTFDLNPRLKTMFPADKWRQYLSIQSGQIQLCNTKLDETATEDSKRSIRTPASDQMSLDLELNLTCESQRKKESKTSSEEKSEKRNSGNSPKNLAKHDGDACAESNKCNKDASGGLNGSPSWLSTSEGDYKEMVATVCMQCHMLVMLCKSSPACPNCKFMHSPDQNPSKFLKSRCTFFCSS